MSALQIAALGFTGGVVGGATLWDRLE